MVLQEGHAAKKSAQVLVAGKLKIDGAHEYRPPSCEYPPTKRQKTLDERKLAADASAGRKAADGQHC
jgi:hypothetical protein